MRIIRRASKKPAMNRTFAKRKFNDDKTIVGVAFHSIVDVFSSYDEEEKLVDMEPYPINKNEIELYLWGCDLSDLRSFYMNSEESYWGDLPSGMVYLKCRGSEEEIKRFKQAFAKADEDSFVDCSVVVAEDDFVIKEDINEPFAACEFKGSANGTIEFNDASLDIVECRAEGVSGSLLGLEDEDFSRRRRFGKRKFADIKEITVPQEIVRKWASMRTKDAHIAFAEYLASLHEKYQVFVDFYKTFYDHKELDKEENSLGYIQSSLDNCLRWNAEQDFGKDVVDWFDRIIFF